MKRLVCYDRISSTVPDGFETETLDIRLTENTHPELMEVYESIQPELIGQLRDAIINKAPDEIVIVGTSADYRWLGTVICRVFGQFNSWLNQRQNATGKTKIKVNGRDVTVIAIDSWHDLSQ